MSEEQITHEISLVDGYKGVHKRVVFGKSVSAKRLLALRIDEQSSYQTQYEDLLLAESIIEFGSTPMPVPLTTLLALTDIDREDLRAGRDEFRKKVLGDRKVVVDVTENNRVTLLFGFKFGESRYPIVEYGTRLTGKDEVETDKLGLTEFTARRAFLAGRMITKIGTACETCQGKTKVDCVVCRETEDPECKPCSGKRLVACAACGATGMGVELAGPVGFDKINSEDFDEDDLLGLVVSADLWRQSFRLRGRSIPSVGDRKNDRAPDDEVSGNERGDSAVSAGGEA